MKNSQRKSAERPEQSSWDQAMWGSPSTPYRTCLRDHVRVLQYLKALSYGDERLWGQHVSGLSVLMGSLSYIWYLCASVVVQLHRHNTAGLADTEYT